MPFSPWWWIPSPTRSSRGSSSGSSSPAPSTPGATPGATGGESGPARYGYTNMSIYDMRLSMESPLRGSQRGDKPERDMSVAALMTRIAELSADPAGSAPFRVELHKRFAIPAAALVFALVAFPLAVRSHRGGRSVALAASLVILVSYHLVLTSLEGFALRQSLPAWVAIWTPNILFSVIGTALLVTTALEWRMPSLTFA